MLIEKDCVVGIHVRMFDLQKNLLEETEPQGVTYLHGHGDIFPKLEQALEGKKAAAEFARFGDQVLPARTAHVAEADVLSAEVAGKREPRLQEDMREHRRGRGLAVTSRNGKNVRERAGEQSEKGGAGKDGLALLFRAPQESGVRVGGFRIDDSLFARGVRSEGNGDAEGAQFAREVIFAHIASADSDPLRVQQLCERAHAHTPDTDKIDAFFCEYAERYHISSYGDAEKFDTYFNLAKKFGKFFKTACILSQSVLT